MCGTCGCSSNENHSHPIHEEMHAMGIDHHHDEAKTVSVEKDVLGKNASIAGQNREYFKTNHIYSINLVSSPGSGKTSILEHTIDKLLDLIPITVIEGDQHTSNDTDRILATGVKSVQINTQSGCHLDADMVHKALLQLKPQNNSLLFIENVGNLVCPAMFDLGESDRVVVISVTEGDDKPLKYPYMFESSTICIINKIDLLPYVNVKLDTLKANALHINPNLKIFEISATTEAGLDAWCQFVLHKVKGQKVI